MKVYFDHAATTPLDNEVYEAILPVLKNDFGNPSSSHAFGRKVKAHLEISRRTIAKLLNVTPSEIIFTSGGTEADNMAIRGSVDILNVKNIIFLDIILIFQKIKHLNSASEYLLASLFFQSDKQKLKNLNFI